MSTSLITDPRNTIASADANTITIKAKHAIVTDVCRQNRTTEGAVDEALARLREAALDLISCRGEGKGDRFHFVLNIERVIDTPISRR